MAAVAGYSGTPLPRKLGVKEGMTVALVGAPPGAEDLLPDVNTTRRLGRDHELVLLFTTRRADLAERWPTVTRAMTSAGAIWVAWPKRASGVVTDVNEHVVREVVLPTGWVDTKVCAVDDTWSGLKCVLRMENRPKG